MSKKRQSADDEHLKATKKRKQLSSDINIEGANSSFDESVRCGKIKKIHLTNFMCHSNLKIDLCSRINLLIGANGSGKSAILTALVVGLGAKARDTNRSTSIKQLVKSGENSADIEITIMNSGSEAYEPETYGNTITISRHILASGSSSYKIKNSHGNIVSKKTDELHKILLYHNIQTDNPVFVLNQDSARSFLKEMEPSKNYILFLKATQIETILEKLNRCGIMYQDYKYRLRCYEKQVTIMEAELAKLKEKEERLESADDIMQKVTYHKLEMVWLKVQEQEKVVDDLKHMILVFEEKHESIKKSIDERGSAEQAIKTEIRHYEQEFQEENNSFQSKLEKLNNLKQFCKDAAEKFEQKSYECKKLRNKICEYNKQIESYEERIEERTGSGLTQVQKLRAANEQKLAKLIERKGEIAILIQQHKRELDLLSETKTKQEEDFEDLNRQRKKFADKIITSEKELSKMKSSSVDQFSVYGPQMSAFVEEIKRNRIRFSELPIGPIGQYIHVSEQKWRGPIEHLIGGLLSCFIVNNDKDSRILATIKNKFKGLRNSIITMKFNKKVYDVSSGICHPPRGSTLVFNEIKCSNPVVMNCLIDRGKIETILLTDDQNLAINLTAHEENVPEHLNRVILLNPFLEYCPAPKYRAYSLQERTPRFIQVNMDEIRKDIEIDLDRFNGGKLAAEEKLRCWKSKIVELCREVNRYQSILAKHQSNMNAINEEIEEIESFEYPEETQIEFFKKEISELQKMITNYEENISKIEEETKTLLQNKIDKTKEYDEHKNKITHDEKRVKDLKTSIDDLKTQLHEIKNNANSGQKKLEDLEKSLEENNNKLIIDSKELSNLIETAEKNGDRIEVTKTEDELKKFIKKYEYSLKQISTTDEKLSDIKALIEDKQLRYEKFQLFTISISQTLDMLKKSRYQRFKFILNLKHHMALRVKFTFDSVLKIKNFSGNIEFDHVNQKLTLTIIPRDNHINNAVSNTKSLSGGERSFSTVALLLSLWACVDHPFYFLDEYDVFTDQVNREIMTKLLVSEAERKPHRQYTFLTPQDVSFVEASDNIVIHRLAEPQR